MAFAQSNRIARNNDAADWKAQGFINLYLPSKEGKRVKLGAIPLKESRNNERQLLEWLNANPARAVKLLEKLEIEYKSAEAREGAGLDLGD